MSVLKLDAYIPSCSEYIKYQKKFPAFMSANLTKTAIKQGLKPNKFYKGKRWFPLRSIQSKETKRIWLGSSNGNLSSNYSHIHNTGLRIAFNIKYNPENSIVKNCKLQKRTTNILNYSLEVDENITSVAPIVKFGKHDCIWLNKEDCECGKANFMELWTLDLVEKALPFSKVNEEPDFKNAHNLIEQCEIALKMNCTKQELDMIIPTEFNSEDCYEKANPILNLEKDKNKDSNIENNEIEK